MSRNGDRLTEDESNINTISELPSRPFTVTMELPLFLLMAGISLAGTVINNILLFRTCVHSLHYSEEQCNLLQSPVKNNETGHIEEEAQKYATIVTMVRSMIEALCPAILSLFLGVWSDTYGRKPLVVWPLFGMTLTSMLVVIYSVMGNLGPWWYVLTALPVSLSGGLTSLFTGAFSYVSDITSNSSRSFRLALLEAAVFLGIIIGSILSSYLVQLMGNVWLLVLHSTIFVAAYAFTNIYVYESLTGALKGGLTTVFDLLLVKEMIHTCFKRRPNKMRSIIILLITANGLGIFIMYGVMNLEYLYTRQKLEWKLKEFTIFNAANTLITVAGLLIGVTLMQKVCRMSDLLLANVSYLSSMAEVITRAFAVKLWHMYFGASISLFKGLSSPLIRSLLTKILPLEDIAKVFALTCAMEAILPVFSPIIYNTLYAHTITTFPGAIYLLSAAIYGSCVVMLGLVQFYMWKYPTTPYTALNNT